MYNPRLFREENRERLFDLIEAHSFGVLIAPDDGGALEIAHLPFLLDRGQNALRCHVAKANRIWQIAADGRPVTIVFSGPHTYISPRWYEEPARQVPTWSYAVVHVHGRARAPVSENELYSIVSDLAGVNERGAERPWGLGVTEPGFADGLLGAIVGLSISIDRMEGKFKLSQNRSDEDQRRVRRALRERGGEVDLEMLRWMPAGADD